MSRSLAGAARLIAAAILGGAASVAPAEAQRAQPNILWISTEDFSPDLGVYGTRGAVTPNLDRLASHGIRYTRAYATSGQCAPSRAAIITGMHAPSIGAHHMRTTGYTPADLGDYEAVPPPWVKAFPEYLRAAGYYTTNNAKTDYQFAAPLTAWDENGREAHWRNRPDRSQPFFAVFNFNTTHAGQIWERAHEPLLVDPDSVDVPPYYPDIPVVRREIARYLTNAQLMDGQAGELLRQLEEDGLLENTIVFFWGDHGTSLLRGKRTVYEAGLRVPLIVKFPDRRRAGTVDDRMVSLLDLAPTVLSLAGVPIPAHFHGSAFLGPAAGAPRRYIHAASDRVGEGVDMMRSVREARYHYIRNFRPDQPYMLPSAYRDQSEMVQELKRMAAAGELVGPQALYFAPSKPLEELYDTEADPHEIRNLAADPSHRATLERMRKEMHEWMIAIRDMGFIPEEVMVNQLFRVDGEQMRTEPPVLRRSGRTVALVSTTAGASIAYRFEGEERWRLYREPLALAPGTRVRVVATRIGFKQSPEVVLVVPSS